MSDTAVIDLDDLLARALSARERAFCPYSGYAVGAAVLLADGLISTGCNVENVSYGLSLCAERNAVTAAVVASANKPLIVAIALIAGPTNESATGTSGPVPCGACLQVISEFVRPDCLVICAAVQEEHAGEHRLYRLAELLPHPFGGG